MKVRELAEKLKVTSEQVLETLKALKLRAKDSEQEISAAVVSVVKSELVKLNKPAKKVSDKPRKPRKKVEKKKVEPKVEPPVEIKKVEVKEDKKEEIKPVKLVKEVAAPLPKPVEHKEVRIEIKKELPKVVPSKEIPKVVTFDRDAVKNRFVKPAFDMQKERAKYEPLVTLKPLVRKKRKLTREGGPGEAVVDGNVPQIEKAEGHPKVFGRPQFYREAPPPKEIREEDLVDLELQVPISIKDLSSKIQQKPSIILSQLMKMGIFAHINQSMDSELVTKLAREFGYRISMIKTQEEQLVAVHKKEQEDPSLLKHRAPVVTFMGHVDHGKTSLLDAIRISKVVDTEHGGITQHIGAYSVETTKGRMTFLDTPGHEAFTAMRARGAHITDVVVLVVAADEGVMPQTVEAINHAKAANVQIVVALNKIDKRNADIDRVKKQLSEIGLMPEDWGGKTVCVGVSATTGQGVNELLDLILLESEMLELKANPDKLASGIVVEAHLSQGKGAVTTLIVQSGTLNDGDIIVVGPYYGKVRAMLDDRGRKVTAAGPSMPVEVIGLADVPKAGEIFYAISDEKKAREITSIRQQILKDKKLKENQRVTLEDLYARMQEGSVKELNVIIKADVQGSMEALKDSLGKIPSDRVKIKFIHAGIGDVNASDVILAIASRAIIIAFHVDIDNRAKEELEKDPVDVRQYRIIYDAVNDIRSALEGLLDAKKIRKFVARIEVREVFKLSKHGIVAGCYVTKGKVTRKSKVDVIRAGETVFSGNISSLKRFKDDVREVTEGMECGVTVDRFDKYQTGDIIEVFETETIAQKL